jgi:hypothetical protein
MQARMVKWRFGIGWLELVYGIKEFGAMNETAHSDLAQGSVMGLTTHEARNPARAEVSLFVVQMSTKISVVIAFDA